MTAPRTGASNYLRWLDALAARVEFQRGANGWRWNCSHASCADLFPLARLAAGQVGQSFDSLFAESLTHGSAWCDCELLFNCDPRMLGRLGEDILAYWAGAEPA